MSLHRRLGRLEAALPPPSPPPEDFPLEEWLVGKMRDAIPETSLKNSNDEEFFHGWLAELGRHVVADLYMELNPAAPLPEELLARLFDALPPYVEHWRRAWAENSPSRQERRLWVARNERMHLTEKTEANGYGWWLRWQEECARLRSVYASFEEEWEDFYEEWQEECELTGELMSEQMREDFVGICFMREECERWADFASSIIHDVFEDGEE